MAVLCKDKDDELSQPANVALVQKEKSVHQIGSSHEAHHVFIMHMICRFTPSTVPLFHTWKDIPLLLVSSRCPPSLGCLAPTRGVVPPALVPFTTPAIIFIQHSSIERVELERETRRLLARVDRQCLLHLSP